jgi:hypothetical protein
MGRPKTPAGAAGKGSKTVAMAPVRSTPEWGAWVGRLLEHERMAWPDLVDKALVAYAQRVGFKEPAPRR